MKCPRCHADNPDTSRFCGNCAATLDEDRSPSDSLTKTLTTPLPAFAKDSLVAGKYKILEEIGKGGMGVVYKAEDTKLKRTVALKFLPPQLTLDDDARERFIHEAQAASALDHPNICNIHEIGDTEAGQMYIAMAYYEGESLRERLRRGPLGKEEALGLASQLAQGIDKAHQKGIVHRDLKPANIVITEEGVAKIVDFGLAKLAGQLKLTRDGATVGTVAYMSPEQAQGQSVDRRTDIWSLGVVLYEMLAGQLPFKGEYEQSLIHSILNKAPEPITKIRKDLPMGLEHVISKTLEKAPADRYQSMEELLGDLIAIREGLKPIRAKAGFFRGRILGLKKVYAYGGLAGVVLMALAMVFIFPKRGQAYDSIAVLPFQNISGDPEQESFCDGVQLELITQLSRIKSIKKVIAKSSTAGYKDTKKKSSEIAAELKVAAVVAGAANRSGNKVRINFEIIDGQTDKLIGGDQFDGEYRDILGLQSEAALAIAKKIQASLTPEESRAISTARPINPEAHEAYVKGMFIIGSMDQPSTAKGPALQKSIEYFEQAVRFDPNSALAYAGLAMAYDFSALASSPKEAMSKARDAALRALSLDDSLAEAHSVLADIKTSYEWDWEGAEREFRRSLELNPNYSMAHWGYGLFLAGQGRGDEAVAHAERALELDPQTLTTVSYAIQVFGLAHQYERAISLAKESLNVFMNSRVLHMRLGRLYLGNLLYKEALDEFRKVVELGGPPNMPFLACAYALTGEKSKALEILHSLLKQAKEGYADSFFIACVCAALGEKDKAFEWLETAYEQRNPNMYVLKAEYILFNVQDDPRFAALLRKLKLAR